MAGSLDELIEFLLDEIAVAGELGVTFSTLQQLVQQFYEPRSSEHQNAIQENERRLLVDQLGARVDRPFLSKVWMWLGRHPDVSVGKHKQFNGVSLDDVEKSHPGYTTSNTTEDGADAETPSHWSLIPEPMNVTFSPPIQREIDNSNGPHIYVNEGRMYIAICGHPPDSTRVFPSEWVLLLIIAASKKDGILQGDLVRASGQDKRSVPRRTDDLHAKGYIVKKILYLKGNKTSRLFLRRYADPQRSSNGTTLTAVDQITVRHVARQLFDVLKNNPLIPQEDLSDALGMTTFGRKRVFLQLIKHLGKLGCLKRVKTAFGPSARSKDLKICIQYLKEPTDQEWRHEDAQDFDLDQAVEILASLYEHEAGQTSAANDIESDIGDQDQVDVTAVGFENAQPVRTTLPQWNPDRVLANVLVDAAREASSQGLRNLDARNIITGPFIKRTVESLLVKISNRTMQAQPAHLRHLAILRTHEFHNSVLQYLHYTFEVFVKRVQSGSAKWEDISGGELLLKELKQCRKDQTSITEQPLLDRFGFPLRTRSHLEASDEEATMSHILRAAKIKDLKPRPGEPFLREVKPGQFEVAYKDFTETLTRIHNQVNHQSRKSRQEETSISQIAAKAVSKPADTSVKVTKGRPRKFSPGTEKYWRDVFAQIIQDKDPEFFKENGKTGIMTHPEALQIFQQRPAEFDQTILQAIKLGLPLAFQAEQVSSQWIENMIKVMQRSEPGLYVTPVGYHIGFRMRKAQHLILKTRRLREVDFADRTRCWPWQLLSSSVSHSLRYQRFYPRFGKIPRIVVTPSKLPKHPPKSTRGPNMSGPPRGLFYENVQLPVAASIDVNSIIEQPNQPLEAFDIGESTDATDNEPEIHNPIEVTTQKSLPTTSKRKTANRKSHNRQPLASGPILVTSVTQMANGKNPTRSVRLRKLTQKATENLEAQSAELESYESVSKTPSEALVDSTPTLASAVKPRNFTPERNNSASEQSTAEEEPQTKDSSNQLTMPHFSPAPEVMDTFYSQLQEYANDAADVAQPEEHFSEVASIDQRQEHANETIDTRQLNDQTAQNSTDRVMLDAGSARPPNDIHEPESTVLDATSPVSQALTCSLEDAVAEEFMNKPMETPNKRPNVVVNKPSTPGPRRQSNATPSRKRTRKDGTFEATRAQVAKLCRILVLELVGLCSGLAPNVPWTLRRAMIPRWQEANVKPEQLSAKNVRGAIKALCESGKLKNITFAFRGKLGTMVKMSIITLQSMDSGSPAITDLQTKMSEQEPADYIPPELDAECRRQPNEMNRKRYSKEIQQEEPDDELHEQPIVTPKSSRKTRTSISTAPPSPAVEQLPITPEQLSVEVVQNPSPSPSPSAEPVISLTTGFLTLRIPRLKQLDVPTDYQLRYRIPPVPIRFETDTTRILSTTAAPTPKTIRGSGLRRKRTTDFDPGTHKLIWKKPKKLKLPSCLDDVPNLKLSRDEALFSGATNSDMTLFEAEVDCVAAWEQKSLDLLMETTTDHNIFINHSSSSKTITNALEAMRVDFKALVQYDVVVGDMVDVSLPIAESWPPFVAALQLTAQASRSTLVNDIGTRSRRSTKRKASSSLPVSGKDDDQDYIAPTKRRRREIREERPRRSLRTRLGGSDVHAPLSQPFRRNRMTQVLRYLTEEEKYAIVVSVIIVRTLIGGIEKFIDWDIVQQLIPTQEEHVIRDSWKTMSHRYRSDISEMTESLQHRYLEALINGNVPCINYDDVHASDWKGILQWAQANLDKSIVRKTDELPANRAQLLRRNDYAFSEFWGFRDLLGYNVAATMPKKEEVLSGTVFGKQMRAAIEHPTPLGHKTLAEEDESDAELMRAKSWVMATLLTPEIYDVSRVQTKLFTIAPTPQHAESLLEKAVKALQRDKLVSRLHGLTGIGKDSARDRDEQHFAHLRYYEVSAKFFEQFDFRRMVTTSMLRRAANYKLDTLDPVYTQGIPITIEKGTVLDDGEMIAILNLVAMGMIRIRPGDNVPASRWGLEWQKHGYSTRLINKQVLGFDVILDPIQRNYKPGDPITAARERTVIPRGEIDQVDHMGRIPLWFDITHTFQEGLWEMVLGAILGLVSTRPGSDAREIARTLWYGVSVEEVGMILDFAERAGLASKTSSGFGWESNDWWWMGIGRGGGWNKLHQGN